MQVNSQVDPTALIERLVAEATPRPGALDAWRSFLQAYATLMRRLAGDLVEATGLTLGDFDVLAQLAVAGGELRMSELAARAYSSRSAMTRRVARLVHEGLLTRASDEADARGVVVALTEAGVARLAEAAPSISVASSSYLSVSSPTRSSRCSSVRWTRSWPTPRSVPEERPIKEAADYIPRTFEAGISVAAVLLVIGVCALVVAWEEGRFGRLGRRRFATRLPLTRQGTHAVGSLRCQTRRPCWTSMMPAPCSGGIGPGRSKPGCSAEAIVSKSVNPRRNGASS